MLAVLCYYQELSLRLQLIQDIHPIWNSRAWNQLEFISYSIASHMDNYKLLYAGSKPKFRLLP
jgi:hypothetical protein